MVNFIYKRLLRIREMAYGSAIDTVQSNCDVVYMHSNDEENKSTVITKNCITHAQYTLENDLTIDEDELFSGINKNYKNEIRRAVKEGTDCEVFNCDSAKLKQEIDQFELVYNRMFEAKGMNNSFNRRLICSGLDAGQVIISRSTIGNNDCVVFHAYLVDGMKAMLMYSASTLSNSENRNISKTIGWMNKYLHWFDMKWFKNNGYTGYEWGGINSVEEPNGIAKFKMGFNGKIRLYMNYLTANSLLGNVYISIVKRRGQEWK